MSDWDGIQAELMYVAGGLLLVGGTFVALDGFATMLQINSTGTVGAALGAEEYQDAATQFAYGGAGAALGLLLVIAAAAEVVEYHMKALAGEE